MSTTYPKCRTCMYFIPEGICDRIRGLNFGESLATASIQGAMLLVEPDFGCLLHSEIETDQSNEN